MKRFIKHIFLSILLIFSFMFIFTNVYAEDYTINKYNINMIVNENNSMAIEENIEVYFNTYKHGIFRKIPITNNIARNDGTYFKNNARVKDISVNDKFTTHNENSYKIITIGDKNKTIIGTKNYTINYVYDLGKDKNKDYDEFYFNLIGGEWDTTINKTTFSIKMPKDFDVSKISFYSGIKGSSYKPNILYNVEGNVIVGELNDKLNLGEYLTIRVELPDNYFVYNENNFDYITLISIIIPILFVVITFLIWKKYGKDNKVVKIIQFLPPEEFNSLEVGFLYKGYANRKDVVSLIIYLANKGYIKIKNCEKRGVLQPGKFKIVKLKEYDGNKANEKRLLDGLFINNSNEVDSTELKNEFYKTVTEILLQTNTEKNQDLIFEKNNPMFSKIIVLMIIVVFCLITFVSLYNYERLSIILLATIFPGICFSILFYSVCEKDRNIKMFSLLWGGLSSFLSCVFLVFPYIFNDYKYLIVYVIGLICNLFLVVFYKLMPKRNSYGNVILGKILGFKTFLETTEKENLENYINQNPNYFYDILPYTYVLEVSDKWIKNFENTLLEAPNWYDSTDRFSVADFGHFVDNEIMYSSDLSSSPSSSDSGSSGGGSGGGGGGSW